MRILLHLVFLSFIVLITPTIEAQTVTVLQPGPEEGKDALLKDCVPCGMNPNNYGDHPNLMVVAWTHTDNPMRHRSLLYFDLSSIPEGAEILDARLHLYHDPTINDGDHSSLSGPNTTLLLRITEPWDEYTVSWDNQPATTTQNEVILAESVSPDQDYTDIDVTALITDQWIDPEQGHGFMLRQQTEEYYRRMVFASSDNADPSLRPKLVITHLGGVGMSEQAPLRPTIHPNPTHGRFVISGIPAGSRIEVFDVLGQLVLGSRNPSNGTHLVDLEGMNDGVYFVTIKSAGRSVVQRIVLQQM